LIWALFLSGLADKSASVETHRKSIKQGLIKKFAGLRLVLNFWMVQGIEVDLDGICLV
jgi:hypothetical protein